MNKTATGIRDFDALFGGLFSGRSALIGGARGSGKTTAGLRFLYEGIQADENCLMVTKPPASDLRLAAETMQMPIDTAIATGKLVLLEYKDYIPGRDDDATMQLPPEGFEELVEIVQRTPVHRLVLDTVLPWIMLRDESRLPEHIFSLVRAFDRMGVTALFTIPAPASPASVKLYDLLEKMLPISLQIKEPDESRSERRLLVRKYLGQVDMVGHECPYAFVGE